MILDMKKSLNKKRILREYNIQKIAKLNYYGGCRMEKKILGEEEYGEYLDKMFESAKKIGAKQERLKDYSHEEQEDIEIHIQILTNGFQVHHESKTFMCQTGEQLIKYFRTLPISEAHFLELCETVLLECVKYDIDFPTDLI